MRKQQQRSFSWLLLTAFIACLLLPVPAWAAPAKNVILLMTDGTSSTHLTLARWYKGAPLALDDILVGGLRTYSAESIITDSAPAATAFATGHKTNTKFLGILPEKVTMPGVPEKAIWIRQRLSSPPRGPFSSDRRTETWRKWSSAQPSAKRRRRSACSRRLSVSVKPRAWMWMFMKSFF